MKMRTLALTLMIGLVVVIPAAPAMAHGGEGDLTAKILVEQAIAILRGQPEQMGAIEDKISDALADDETDGVDLALVRQAQEAFIAGQIHKTLDLLEESIGATPHRVIGTSDQVVDPILHERSVGGGLRAPTGTAGPVLIVIAAALALIGGVAVRKVH